MARSLTQLTGALVLTLALLLGLAGPAAAAFGEVLTTNGGAIGTARLQPPTNLASTGTTCSGTTFAPRLTWTASTSAYRTGYTIMVSKSGGAPYVVTTVAATATTWTASYAKGNATYSFSVVTTYRNWTATSSATAAIAC